MREEHPVLAPRERGYQCGTGPVGERDVRRGQERLASEELDALADAGYCSVREEAEHTAPPKDAVDAESRIHWNKTQTLCAPRAVHSAHELGRGAFDRQRQLEAARHQDLAHQCDRSQVRAPEDDALSERVGAGEVLPAFHPHGREEVPAVEARDVEDLEVLNDGIDENASHARRMLRRDHGEVRTHRSPGPRGREVGDGTGDLRDGSLPGGRHPRENRLG